MFKYSEDPKVLTGQIEKLTNYKKRKINLESRVKKLEGSENIIFFDPFKEINCCKNLNEYKNFLRDTDHLSEYGSQKISERLVPFILGE